MHSSSWASNRLRPIDAQASWTLPEAFSAPPGLPASETGPYRHHGYARCTLPIGISMKSTGQPTTESSQCPAPCKERLCVPFIGYHLSDILCEQHERKVAHDNCVSFEGMSLQIARLWKTRIAATECASRYGYTAMWTAHWRCLTDHANLPSTTRMAIRAYRGKGFSRSQIKPHGPINRKRTICLLPSWSVLFSVDTCRHQYHRRPNLKGETPGAFMAEVRAG